MFDLTALTVFGEKLWNVFFHSERLWNALDQTLMMVGISGGIAIIIGVPMGILLIVTDKGGLMQNLTFNRVFGFAVNVFRSIPFIILCFILIGFSRWLVHTSIGTVGAIVPLTVAAIPFMARLAETSFKEVPSGLIEAAQSMGATPLQIIYKVILAEAMPGLIAGITIMMVSLIGYSAMAGFVGGGGLGDYAINHGYQRNKPEVTTAGVVAIVVLVQLVQWVGDWLSAKMNHR